MTITLNLPLPDNKKDKLALHATIVKYCYADKWHTLIQEDRSLLIVDVHLRDSAQWSSFLDALPPTVTAMKHGVPIVCKGQAELFYTQENLVVPMPYSPREVLLPKLAQLSYSHSRFNDWMLKTHKFTPEDIHLLKAWDITYVGTENGRDFYATPEQHALEKTMLLNALARQNEGRHPVSHDVIAEYGETLSQEQFDALVHINGRDGITVAEGMAGTGKSTMMKVAKVVWEHSGYIPIGMALSGKAQAGLQAGSGIPSSTIHRFLMNLENGMTLHSKHILVVDEAGMVPSSLMAKLVRACESAGAKLVLLGDDRQLQPIEAGGPFKVLKDTLGSARLTTIYRQYEAWARDSVHAFADGRAQDGLTAYQHAGWLHFHKDDITTMQHLVALWDKLRTTDCQHDFIMAGKKEEVARLNALARQARVKKGDINDQETVIINTTKGRLALAPNDRVLFSKNNTDMGVTNGQLATITSIGVDTLTVQMDDGGYRTIDVMEYDEFDYGYAMTVHKAQGVTVARSYGYVSSNMDREMSYVMMSRFRECHHLFVDNRQFSRAKVIELMNRPRTKTSSVDTMPRYDHHYWFTLLSNMDGLKSIENRHIDVMKALRYPASQTALKNPVLWEQVVAQHCANLTYGDGMVLLQSLAPMDLTAFITKEPIAIGM